MQENFKITDAVINGERQPAVDARELWGALGSKQEFSKWIKDRLADFEEDLDYRFDKIVKTGAAGVTGKQLYHEYTLTIDTAKHLCMLERNEAGKKIRQYFIEFEKNARKMIEAMADKANTVVIPDKRSLRASTIEMLDMINRKIIAGAEVDKEILRYAWNIGRLFNKEMRRATLADDFTDFIQNIAPGRYNRGDVYAMYCANCSTPVSPRRFWPIVRSIRPCEEFRNACKRFVVFE